MSSCHHVSRMLDAFLDGELSAESTIEVQEHLVGCRRCSCQLRLSQAIRSSVRREAHASARVSTAFEHRVQAALAAERVRQNRVENSVDHARRMSWRSMAPLAVAAAGVIVWGAARAPEDRKKADVQVATPALGSATSVTATVDQLLDELIDYHAKPTAPELTEPSLVPRLEPQVGVPVRLPKLQDYGARWEGGSVVPVKSPDRRAASLRYRLAGHRVTFYVYDADRLPLRATLEPRVVRGVPVYVGTRRGYSVAASEQRGVGYAVTTDLDNAESAELVAASTVMH